MQLSQLIDDHGIKRQFIADKMKLSKATISKVLNNKGKQEHKETIKATLKDNALSLLNKL